MALNSSPVSRNLHYWVAGKHETLLRLQSQFCKLLKDKNLALPLLRREPGFGNSRPGEIV